MINLIPSIDEAMTSVLNEATREERLSVCESLMTTFVESTRKKPVPDINQRLVAMRKQVEEMCLTMRFEFNTSASAVVITVEGRSQDIFLQLERGTDWYEGRDIGNEILQDLAKARS